MSFKFKIPPTPKHRTEQSSPYELCTGDIIVQHPVLPVHKSAERRTLTATNDPIAYEVLGAYIRPEDHPRRSYGLSYVAKHLTKSSGGKRESRVDEHVFIKTPLISQSIPHDQVQRILADIFASFVAEYQNRSRIRSLNYDDLTNAPRLTVAEIKGFGLYQAIDVERSDSELVIPFLVQEFVNELPLDMVFRRPGVTDPDQWFRLAEDIVDLVRRVHNRQIIHGEIIPKNILLRKVKDRGYQPILVDFGKSFQLDISSMTGPPTRRSDPYIAPECREKNLGWYTPADIYSLGGVLLFLATGEDPPDIMKPRAAGEPAGTSMDVETWKRVLLERFSSNDGLMAKNESIVKIIDKCMRPQPTNRYPSAEWVLSALRAVNHRATRADSEIVKRHVGTLQESLKADNHTLPLWDPLFDTILSDRLQMLGKHHDDMRRGHFEIWGEREELIDALVKYLGVLEEGDVYLTVTVPGYWTQDNLGVNGRFLTLNKDLARRGVSVNRLFLVSERDFAEHASARPILEAHQRAWDDLPIECRLTTPIPLTTINRSLSGGHHSVLEEVQGGMFVGCYVEDDGHSLPDIEALARVQGQTSNVAMWSRRRTGKKMSLTFFTLAEIEQDGRPITAKGRIVKVRFRILTNEVDYNRMLGMFWRGDKPMPLLSEMLSRPAKPRGRSEGGTAASGT